MTTTHTPADPYGPQPEHAAAWAAACANFDMERRAALAEYADAVRPVARFAHGALKDDPTKWNPIGKPAQAKLAARIERAALRLRAVHARLGFFLD